MTQHDERRTTDAGHEPDAAHADDSALAFDRAFWEEHWQRAEVDNGQAGGGHPPNPHLMREVAHLPPGKALDAGCGAGAEALWLAAAGWQVTAVDIAPAALARAAQRAAASGVASHIRWIEADLTTWQPNHQFDLVTSHYAHPAMSHLDFYAHIAGWVRPGGTLLLVGHLHAAHAAHTHADAGSHPPPEAAVTTASIVALLAPAQWSIETAAEHERVLRGQAGRTLTLHDVVVRAVRRR